jgi:hypothetical protein
MTVIVISNTSGGSGGMVDSVTAGDLSIVVGGTAANPTIETGTLDEIATLHPPAGAVGLNGQALTGVGAITAAGPVTLAAASGTVLETEETGDTNPRLTLSAGGVFAFGPGNMGTDTDLYRGAAGVLQTSVAFNAGGLITATAGLAVNGQKITGLANGTASTDATAFGQLAAKLSLTGGTMSGAIAMGSNKITGLTNGSGAQDAAAYGQTLGGGNLAPLTTEGDLLYANATPAAARLAIGAASTSLQSNGTLPSWQPALTLLAATTTSGYTLVNGTGTIISWTAPNDGNLHRVMVFAALTVTTTQVGGQLEVNFTAPGGAAGSPVLYAGSLGTGTRGPGVILLTVEAGSTVSVVQSTAQSSGASVLWAELWGS